LFLNFIFGITLFIGCSNDTKTLDYNLTSKDIKNKLSQQNKELLTFQPIGKRKYLIHVGILNNRGQTNLKQRVLDYSNSPCD
jgi:hypothetical protein